jgi:hypothetical protein
MLKKRDILTLLHTPFAAKAQRTGQLLRERGVEMVLNSRMFLLEL